MMNGLAIGCLPDDTALRDINYHGDTVNSNCRCTENHVFVNTCENFREFGQQKGNGEPLFGNSSSTDGQGNPLNQIK
jgi:hypothetical protein